MFLFVLNDFTYYIVKTKKNKNNNNKLEKNKIKDYAISMLYNVLAAVFLWVGITSTIQRFKCPSMTETELLLHIPNSFVCDWTHCE